MTSTVNHPEVIEIFDDSDNDITALPARQRTAARGQLGTLRNPSIQQNRQPEILRTPPPAATDRDAPRRAADLFPAADAQMAALGRTLGDNLDQAIGLIQEWDRQLFPNKPRHRNVQTPYVGQARHLDFADRVPPTTLRDRRPASPPYSPTTPPPQHHLANATGRYPNSAEDEGAFDRNDIEYILPVEGSPSRPKEPARPVVEFDIVLQQILEIFPDICPSHVRDIYEERVSSYPPAENLGEIVIMQIAENGEKYPKAKTKKPARKRKSDEGSDEEEDEDLVAEYTSKDRPTASAADIDEARRILAQDFPTVPTKFIKDKLDEYRNLYPAYYALAEAVRSQEESKTVTYEPLKRRRTMNNMMRIFDPSGRMQKEYSTAKRRLQKENATRAKQKRDAEEDAALDKKAYEQGETKECECCFTDAVLRKMVHCDGENPHFFCVECVQGHVKAQLDYQKYHIQCMASADCKGEFSRASKQKCLDKETFTRLERVQQQAELREANVPGLETCPFCDFAAICPPIEEDKEFRCEHPDCKMVSCRLCRNKSHVPKTCEESKKEHGIEERHIVEEEMTKALIRTCSKCKVAILKTEGCNKIICSRCGAYICDVCGKDISKDGYSHFGPNKCAQYDYGANGATTRENLRVQEAEKAARAKVRADNPDISDADLEIKFSDAVKEREGRFGNHTRPEERIALMEGMFLENDNVAERIAALHGMRQRLQERERMQGQRRNEPDRVEQPAAGFQRRRAEQPELFYARNEAINQVRDGYNRFGRDNHRPDFAIHADMMGPGRAAHPPRPDLRGRAMPQAADFDDPFRHIQDYRARRYGDGLGQAGQGWPGRFGDDEEQPYPYLNNPMLAGTNGGPFAGVNNNHYPGMNGNPYMGMNGMPFGGMNNTPFAPMNNNAFFNPQARFFPTINLPDHPPRMRRRGTPFGDY